MAAGYKNSSIVSMIDVHIVKPENQQKLLDVLIDLTENVMINIPGFISACFHKSLDGTKVSLHAQWESKEHWEAMVKNPIVQPHFQQVWALQEVDSIYALYKFFHSVVKSPENA